MLKLFRNQGKALRWIMGCILFLVAASMVITLVPNVFGPAGPASADMLADVAGIPVTTGDVEVELRQYRASDVPPETLSLMAGSAIENLISERVLFAEASDLGLVPNNEVFAQWLRQQLPDMLFPDGKFVGGTAYAGFVRQQFRRTVPEFEREILYDYTIQLRLRRMVTDSVTVSDEEVKDRFHQENDAFRIEWTAVDSDDLLSEVDAPTEKLQEYFDSNKLRYRHPERRRLKVMTVGPEASASQHEVTDSEIQIYYSQNQYRFEQPERIKVRHILFSTMEGSAADEDAAREKAESVLAELREGADFEAMAKAHSEDPGNADNGGDLGWVSRGMLDPAFEEASFALRIGDLAPEAVKSDFGYHLIRLDDRESGSIKPLSEVREVIRADIGAERSQSDRYALMERAMEAARQAGTALERVAEDLGLPYQEFAPFSRSELPADLPKSTTLVQSVFEQPLGQAFSASEEETLYIGVVAETIPARDAQFEEVSATVRADYIDTEAANAARVRAEELAQRSRESDAGLASEAGRDGLQTVVSDPIRRDGELGELGPVAALGEDAFTKTAGELQGPVPVGSRWVVFRTVELLPADESALTTQGDSLREAILGEKQEQVFDLYRQGKVQEYTANGRVVRYNDLIQAYLLSMQRLG